MSKRLGLAAMAALAACLIGAAESALAQGRGRAGEGAGVGAQSAAADSARLACSAAVRSQREAEAKAVAKEAERLYRRLIAARPKDPEPRVQLAQVLSICKIPYADFLGQGRILSQANKLLEEALALDPSHWSARYTLAMNHYSTPAFLGRTEAAIREFELLLEQQGDRADSPQLAVPYIYLGDLYERKKRTEDAQAIWRRGAALFPDDSRLPERLERVREAAGVVRSPGPALPPGAAGRNEPDSAPRAADFVLEPLTAQASVFRLDDTDGGAALGSLDIYTTPGGTADLLQVFQTLPGVTRASEGSDLYIRGGDPAETPVFVDGARLFYAGTFESLHGGIFGVLDPAVLRRAYFSSGGFSARYGDALSGVLDLESEGRPTTRTGRIGLSMVGAGATLRTPLGERVGAWASVRGTHTSLLLRTRSQRQDYPRAPRSIEGTVGVMAAPSHRLELRAVALAEGDASTRTVEYGGYAGDFESEGTTRLALLSARYLTSGGGATWRATAAVTERTSSFAFGVLDRERGDQALSLRLDGDLTRGGLRVRTGLEASTAERSEGGMVPLTDRLDPGAPARHIDTTAGGSAHLGAYLEGDWLLGRRLALSAGVRADRLPGEDVWTGDPRLALSARAGNDWVLRLGGGIFHQGRRRVQYRIPDEGTPTGVPRRARHLAASVERIGEPSLRLEAYVKEYDRYVPPGEGAPGEGALGEGPPVVAGSAQGLDAVVRWREGRRLNGWITYSLLRGRLELDDGRRIPSAADVTHTLTTVGKLNLGPWEAASTLRYGTGRPYTPIVGGMADAAGRFEPIYGATHGARFPDYRRLDARLTRYTRITPGLLVVYLEMLNLLDRGNVLTYTYDATYEVRRPIESFFASRTLVLGLELRF